VRTTLVEAYAATRTLTMTHLLSLLMLGILVFSSGCSSNRKSFVILSNLQSGNNIGDVCRNALAFNVHEVLVVGKPNFKEKLRGSDRGAKSRLVFKHYNSIAEAATYLRTQFPNTLICGIEIMESATSIASYQFQEAINYCFLFGNEGGGLSQKQREICDKFLYIPQYASGGMASINVACASAVVLSTFANQARYSETTIRNEKFI